MEIFAETSDPLNEFRLKKVCVFTEEKGVSCFREQLSRKCTVKKFLVNLQHMKIKNLFN